MAEWIIPVTYEMSGEVTVEADTLEDAIEIARTDESIGLPPDADYVDGSWYVTDSDTEFIRDAYNDSRPDEES